MPVVGPEEVEELLEDRHTSGKMFLKEAENRQKIQLPTGYETSLQDEVEAMQSLYAASPQNTVEPYETVEQPRGYLMEYFPGEPLQPEETRNPERIAEQLNELGHDILENKAPHGDIRRQNILVKDGDLKMIDAAGITPGMEGTGPVELYQQAVSWDLTDINKLIRDIGEFNNFDAEDYKVAQPALEF